jgi:glycolate oxidase FAD binding subunit
MHTGAWGTLGVITEVTVRLRALPAVDRAFVISFDQRRALESVLAPLVNLAIAPIAMELLNASLAQTLGLPFGDCLLVRLGGNAVRVAGEADRLSALGDVHERPIDIFTQLQQCEPERAIVAQISHMPTMMSATWRHVSDVCAQHQLWQPQMRASLARGMVRMVIADESDGARDAAVLASFVRRLAPLGGHVSWERLPHDTWPHVASRVADRLSIGLRQRLDPAHVLNRGLLGEPRLSTALDAHVGAA